MKRLVLSLVVAMLLWFLLFSPQTSHLINFWFTMSCSALLLTTLAILFGGRPDIRFSLTEVAIGIALAVLLWLVFWLGDQVSQLLFSFARDQVNLIYNNKVGTNLYVLSILLLFLIGPAEELFWRGYVQRTLTKRFSANVAFFLTTAVYTLVHVPSMNFMLIIAALVCGLVWGGMFRLFPQHFTAIVISHALWDAAAFVWFPF